MESRSPTISESHSSKAIRPFRKATRGRARTPKAAAKREALQRISQDVLDSRKLSEFDCNPSSHRFHSHGTANTAIRPSIPRTSCGGSSSKLNESPERCRTAAVTSNGLPIVFVSPSMREAMFTVFPIAVNSKRCGEPTLPTIAGPEWIPIPI